MTEQKPRELWAQKGSFTEMIVENSEGYTDWNSPPVKFIEASALDQANAEIEKLKEELQNKDAVRLWNEVEKLRSILNAVKMHLKHPYKDNNWFFYLENEILNN